MKYSKIIYSLLLSEVVRCTSSCPSTITELGYPCCSDSNCIVVYTDEDGDWAIENDEWCGCGGGEIVNTTTTNIAASTNTPSSCSSKILEQGYSCCSDSNCEVVITDEDGDWAIENDEWCSCDGTKTQTNPTGTSCFNSSGHTGESVEVTSNKVGRINEVSYELWANSGNKNAIFYADGSFSCLFRNSMDYICHSGLSFDNTKTYDQIGHLFADFEFVEEYSENVDFSFVGAYGWFSNPAIEFYIVDNWLNQSRPEHWDGYKYYGDFVIDEATYAIYENENNQYGQFLSVRKEARNCGRIDISAHFALWEKLGMKLGKMYYVRVFAEAGSNGSGASGKVDFPYAKVFIDNSIDIPDFNDIVIPTPITIATSTTTTTTEPIVTSTRTSCLNSSGHTGESVEVTSNKTGNINGVDYEAWGDGGKYNATFYDDGSFTCSFQGLKDYICGSGLNFNGAKTYEEIGQLYADFDFVDKNVKNIDYSYVGVYGLTNTYNSGYFEFYIVDDWLTSYRPGDWVGNKKYGDFVIDGATYTVYSNIRVGPGMYNNYYYQYFSIRKEPRNCGRIDITAHLKQWEKLGMRVSNKINKFYVFAQAGSNGSRCDGMVDFTYAKVFTADIDTITPTTSATTAAATSTTTTTSIITTNPTEANYFNSSNHTGESVEVTSNKVGKINEVSYEMWSDGGNNNALFFADGSFSCSFQDSVDYICRSGLSFDSTKTHDQIGQFYADFKFEEKYVDNVDTSYVGVYGWSRLTDNNILVEYYIIDNWLSQSHPGDWDDYQNHGDFEIDGATYTVYENGHRSGPGTLKQYISVRKEARSCGRIDITAHFKQWEKLDMQLGKIEEVKIFAEAVSYGSGCSGTVDFSYSKVYIKED